MIIYAKNMELILIIHINKNSNLHQIKEKIIEIICIIIN